MTGNKITIFKVSFFVDFILCSVFKSSLNHNYPESPSFCASISGADGMSAMERNVKRDGERILLLGLHQVGVLLVRLLAVLLSLVDT